jgi:Flp pilus assembly protein TadD
MLSRSYLVGSLSAAAVAVALSGCAGGGGIGPLAGLATGSTAPPAESSVAAPVKASPTATPVAAKAATEAVASAAVREARAIRAKGDVKRALAGLERVQAAQPSDREIAREIGYLALQLGELDKARKALELGIDPAHLDWRAVAALGAVHAHLGDQPAAQTQLKKALELNPGHGPTLNNLALSYALAGKLAKAESTLRVAAKGAPTKQIKENLALVLALAGKYADAEQAVDGVMPKPKVVANMEYLRSLKQKDG